LRRSSIGSPPRQVAPDGASDIDHLATPGRRASATETITDGAGEALGDQPGLRRLFRGDERAQVGPGERVTAACDQPTGAAPVRPLEVPLRMFGPADCWRGFFARQHRVPDNGPRTSVPNTGLGLGGGDDPGATAEPIGIEELAAEVFPDAAATQLGLKIVLSGNHEEWAHFDERPAQRGVNRCRAAARAL
jgi:hypothetical protein